jgi:hypothetical protein
MLATFGSELEFVGFLKQKPVHKNVGKIMKLPPGAPEVKQPVAIRVKRPVKSHTVPHSERE